MSDNELLYSSSVICLMLIIVSFRFNRQFGIINIIFFCLYNLLLYYNLFYKNDGGSGFSWWFYLIILTVIQILVIIIYLGIKLFTKTFR